VRIVARNGGVALLALGGILAPSLAGAAPAVAVFRDGALAIGLALAIGSVAATLGLVVGALVLDRRDA
jgi:hypothetical protein